MILLGLYHGLIFLPILLSLIGPSAYKQHKEKPIIKKAMLENAKEDDKDILKQFLAKEPHQQQQEHQQQFKDDVNHNKKKQKDFATVV